MIALIRRLKEDHYWNWMLYLSFCEYKQKQPSRVEFWLGILAAKLCDVRCAIFGHDLVDDDEGTPDYGYIGVHCIRCGYSVHTRLY